MRTVLSALALCGLLAGAEGRLTGPVPAYWLDSNARSVRAVLGVPGAAYAGGSVIENVDAAGLSPDGALLAVLRGRTLLLLRENNGEWTSTVLSNDIDGPMALAWSTDSRELSVATASGALRTWKTDGAELAARALPEGASALAVSAAGAVALARGGVYTAGESSARLIAPADHAVAVALHGSEVYYCDAARGEVRVVSDMKAPGGATLAAKLDDPVGVGVDAARKLLLVASKTRVMGLRLGTWEPVFDIALDFEASKLEPFGKAGWLLNAGQDGPLHVLSLDDSPAVFFIPNEGRN